MSNAIQSIVLTPKTIKGIANQNQYAFNVNKKLKKPEIKKICEDIFNTKVISVNTSILPQKKYRPNFKRALVKFEKIKPYSHLFQNIYLSNRLKTKLKLLKKKNPLNTLEKQANQAKIKKNRQTWLSTNTLLKKDSNSKISQNYDYNSLMNIINFPDSFVDHFIKQRVENNKYQNVIDFNDWVFLMKNRLDNSIKYAPSQIDEFMTGTSSSFPSNLYRSRRSDGTEERRDNNLEKKEKITFHEENFSFKPLTQKDKTDFSLLQKTTLLLTPRLQNEELKKKEPSTRQYAASRNGQKLMGENNGLVKKKKKKNFLLFTFSFPLNKSLNFDLSSSRILSSEARENKERKQNQILNQKLKLKLPLMKTNILKRATDKQNQTKQAFSVGPVFDRSRSIEYKATQTGKQEKKKNTKSPVILYQEKKGKIESLIGDKRAKQETKKSNLFLDILSKTKISFSLPFSLPRSFPFISIGSKLKTKPKFKLKPKKKAARWQLRFQKKKKSKTSKQVTEFLNTVRSIQRPAFPSFRMTGGTEEGQENNELQKEIWLNEQAIKIKKQRLLKKIEKKNNKKKYIALIPSFLWPYIIEYGKKKQKTNLSKIIAKKQILSFSAEAINRKNVDISNIPEIKIKKLSTFVRPGKKEKNKITKSGRFTPLLKMRLSAFGREERVNIITGKRKYKNLIQKKKKNIFDSVKNFFGKILEPLRENRKKREQQKKSREIILDVARYKVVLWLRLMKKSKSFYNFDQVTNFEFFDFKNKNFRYPNNKDKEDLLIMKALRRAEFFQKINNQIYNNNISDSYGKFARLNSKTIRTRKMKDTEHYQRRTLFDLKRRIIENDFFLRIFKMKPSDELTINDLWEIADMNQRDRSMNWSQIKTSWKRNNKAKKKNRKKEIMLFIYVYKIYQKMNLQLKQKRQRMINTFDGRKKKIFSNNKFNLKTINYNL